MFIDFLNRHPNIKYLLDLIWPRFYDDPDDPTQIEVSHIKKELEKVNTLELLRQMKLIADNLHKREYERLTSTIQRSITILGATGIMSAILLVIANLKSTTSQSSTSPNLLVKILFLIFFVYIFQTIRYCLDAIKPRGYWRIDVEEIIKDVDEDKIDLYLRARIYDLLEYIERNKIVINSCIDSFILARSYFRNTVFTLILIGIVLVFT